MNLLEKIINKAKENIKTIVLPEGKDRRTIDAAKEIKTLGVADIIVLINESDMSNDIKELQTLGIKTVVIEKSANLQKYGEMLYELRKAKGMTLNQAKELVLDPLYYGVMMVKNKDADGMVAGAIHATRDVLRPALQILRTAPGVKLVSSFFLMEVQHSKHTDTNVFAFSDCGLVVNPDKDELAEIAVQTAKSFDFMTGKEPLVAMLSFSTYGSASGPLVEKVIDATDIVKRRYPNLKVDGELQLDAAIVPEVARLKAKGSPVAGYANVLIFPDLQAGNIGYKLVQRLANANAYGPITQGLSSPVNDLSRGCSYEDIVAVCAITSLQTKS